MRLTRCSIWHWPEWTRMRLSALAVLVSLSPALADSPSFAPVQMPPHSYDGGWEHFVGGGLAAFDCSGDGLPELLAAGGSAPMQLMRNHSDPGGVLHFDANTPPELAITHATGAYPIDLNSDGLMDLVVLRVGANAFLLGQGDCRFTPFDAGLALRDDWTTAFSATWEDGQVWPTLAFGNYVDRADPDGPFRACDENRLYRPGALGYVAAAPLTPGHCTLSMLFSDWARKGRADLRISNDRHYYVDDGQEQLWKMTDPPRLYTRSDGWRSHKLWGMGIASRDLDRDGHPEVFLTSMGDQHLHRRIGPGAEFEDAPFERGITAHRPYTGGDGRPSTGWHVAFGDVTNDGRDDIFITKGNVEQMPGSAMKDPNNLLIQQRDGTFAETGALAGLASLHRGRGAALIDLNRDGLLDVTVNNRRAPLEVWQNVSADTGHWISLGLRQPAPNVNAIGAWVELSDGQARELTIGGGHAGGSAAPEHFGLGTTDQIRMRVIWPDGQVSAWTEIGVDRGWIVQRDGSALRLLAD